MAVIDVDGIDTVKNNARGAIILTAGQRYSAIVEMNTVGNEHWIVAEADLSDMIAFDEANINPNPRDMIRAVRAKLVNGNGNPDPEKLPYPPELFDNVGIRNGN